MVTTDLLLFNLLELDAQKATWILWNKQARQTSQKHLTVHSTHVCKVWVHFCLIIAINEKYVNLAAFVPGGNSA